MVKALLDLQGQTHLVARTLSPSQGMRAILLKHGFNVIAEGEVTILSRPPAS